MLFFEKFYRDFGTLGIEIAKIVLKIQTHHPRIRLYANFGKFICIISLKNNQLAWFFLSPCHVKFLLWLELCEVSETHNF